MKGWECPKCGAVLAPHVEECPYCRPAVVPVYPQPNPYGTGVPPVQPPWTITCGPSDYKVYL